MSTTEPDDARTPAQDPTDAAGPVPDAASTPAGDGLDAPAAVPSPATPAEPADADADDDATALKPLGERWYWSHMLRLAIGVVVTVWQVQAITSDAGPVAGNWVLAGVGVVIGVIGLAGLVRGYVGGATKHD